MVLALCASVQVIFWTAVLTGRLRPRQRPGVPARDPVLRRRLAALGLGVNLLVLVHMLGFLVFPDSLVLVAAVLLPVWIVFLVLMVKLRADMART